MCIFAANITASILCFVWFLLTFIQLLEWMISSNENNAWKFSRNVKLCVSLDSNDYSHSGLLCDRCLSMLAIAIRHVDLNVILYNVLCGCMVECVSCRKRTHPCNMHTNICRTWASSDSIYVWILWQCNWIRVKNRLHFVIHLFASNIMICQTKRELS